jgi:FkbM family methyltransferase
MSLSENLAQFCIDTLLTDAGPRLTARIARTMALRLRPFLVRRSDPAITYRLDGMDIGLPLSHELPFFRKYHPLYSSNLGRIVRKVAAALEEFTLVDVGANVGDSVAIIRSQCYCPILCIEGAETYYSYLIANTANLRDIELEKCFVATETASAKAKLDVRSGTARLTPGGERLHTFKRLSEIVAAHVRFSNPGFIKIDTDGMDCEILRCEASFLKRTQPIVFFEYDPNFLPADEEMALSVFDSLAEAGYDRLLVYENLGDLMLSSRTTEKSLLQDLHHYFSGRQSLRYCDICAFPQSREHLWSEIKSSEIAFFQAFRAGLVPE